jgi:hypothetical protein
MSWMTDERAAKQILGGLHNNQNPGRWKFWLRYGFVVLLAGIAAGGTFLTMRSPSPPIAPVTPEVAVEPTTTIAFPSLLPADMPQGGWKNPEVEKMRWRLNPRPSRAADAKSQSSGSGSLAPGGRALGDLDRSRLITESPISDVRLATPRAERKPSAPQPTSRRHWPRYSVGNQADREETARLMSDELRQRGAAVGAASGSGHME